MVDFFIIKIRSCLNFILELFESISDSFLSLFAGNSGLFPKNKKEKNPK